MGGRLRCVFQLLEAHSGALGFENVEVYWVGFLFFFCESSLGVALSVLRLWSNKSMFAISVGCGCMLTPSHSRAPMIRWSWAGWETHPGMTRPFMQQVGRDLSVCGSVIA